MEDNQKKGARQSWQDKPAGESEAAASPSVEIRLTRFFAALESWMIFANLTLQVLDWITSYIGYSEGHAERNPQTLALIHLLGNEYYALGVEKASFIVMFVVTYYLVRAFATTQNRPIKWIGLFLFLVFLTSFIGVYVPTIANNFRAILP